MLIMGKMLAGRIHNYSIATEFIHIFFFPLIPIRSYIVVNNGVFSWDGEQVPLNITSVLVGWTRALLMLSIILAWSSLLGPSGLAYLPAKSVTVLKISAPILLCISYIVFFIPFPFWKKNRN